MQPTCRYYDTLRERQHVIGDTQHARIQPTATRLLDFLAHQGSPKAQSKSRCVRRLAWANNIDQTTLQNHYEVVAKLRCSIHRSFHTLTRNSCAIRIQMGRRARWQRVAPKSPQRQEAQSDFMKSELLCGTGGALSAHPSIPRAVSCHRGDRPREWPCVLHHFCWIQIINTSAALASLSNAYPSSLDIEHTYSLTAEPQCTLSSIVCRQPNPVEKLNTGGRNGP